MTRWIAVLMAFAEAQEWGARELAKDLNLPRSSVHRILQTMEGEGLLTLTAETSRYRVGPDLLRLSLIVTSQLDLAKVAPDILQESARLSGETVVLALYVPSQHQFRTVDAAESDHAVRYIPKDIGKLGALHIGASGKGILAFLPESEREDILRDLPDPLPTLGISKDALRDQLAKARDLGYIVSHGERTEGTVGASAPIRDASTRVIGDLIVTWPSYRNTPRKELELGELVRRQATAVSGALGFRPSTKGRT